MADWFALASLCPGTVAPPGAAANSRFLPCSVIQFLSVSVLSRCFLGFVHTKPLDDRASEGRLDSVGRAALVRDRETVSVRLVAPGHPRTGRGRNAVALLEIPRGRGACRSLRPRGPMGAVAGQGTFLSGNPERRTRLENLGFDTDVRDNPRAARDAEGGRASGGGRGFRCKRVHSGVIGSRDWFGSEKARGVPFHAWFRRYWWEGGSGDDASPSPGGEEREYAWHRLGRP